MFRSKPTNWKEKHGSKDARNCEAVLNITSAICALPPLEMLSSQSHHYNHSHPSSLLYSSGSLARHFEHHPYITSLLIVIIFGDIVIRHLKPWQSSWSSGELHKLLGQTSFVFFCTFTHCRYPGNIKLSTYNWWRPNSKYKSSIWSWSLQI